MRRQATAPGADTASGRRRLPSLIVTALVVLGLVFAGPQANAASTGWTTTIMEFDGQSLFGVTYRPSVQCGVSVRVVNTNAEVDSVWCNSDLDVTPGWTQAGEAGSDITIGLEGEGCSGTSGARNLNAAADDAWDWVSSEAGPFSWNTGPSCNPSAVCIRIDGFGGGYAYQCQDVGFPPPDTGECAYGTVNFGGATKSQVTSGLDYWQVRASVGWRNFANPDSSQGWRIRVVYFDISENAYNLYSSYTSVAQQGTWVVAGEKWQAPDNLASARPGSWDDRNVVGIQVYYEKVRPLTATLNAYAGVTRPDACMFYIGQPIMQNNALPPGGGSRTPWGAMDSTIADPASDPPPNPAPVNPNTDGPDGGISQLLAMIATLIAAIGNIAQILASLVGTALAGFLEMFKMLFIPNPSSWGMEALFDSVGSKFPFNVGMTVGSAAQGAATSFSGGSCGSLVEVPIAGTGAEAGVDCAQVRTTTGPLRLIFSAVLVVFTGWGIYTRITQIAARTGS